MCCRVDLLCTFAICLSFLILVQHLLDFLNVLFVQLLLICLSFKSSAKLLTAVILLGKQHIFLFNRVLCVHELVLQFSGTVILTVHSACVEVLILHQLVLEIDGADLVALADVVEGATIEALIRVGHVHVLEAHGIVLVHVCEVI